MTRTWIFGRLVAGCLLVSACASHEHVPAATVTRDTSPGGVVSVTSSGPTAWADSGGWTFTEVARLAGTDTAAGGLIQPVEGGFDDAGRLYVVDNAPAAIKLFDRGGRFVRTVGHDGEGPGEYRSPLVEAGGGYVVVHDPRLRRTSVFDSAGRFVRSWPSVCCAYGQIFLDDSGRVAVPAMTPPGSGGAPVRYSLAGTLLDTVLVPLGGEVKYLELTSKSSRMRMTVPHSPGVRYAVGPDGLLLHAWSARYRVAVSRHGADTVMTFGRSWTPVAIPEAERDSGYHHLTDGLRTQWGAAAVNAALAASEMPREAPAMEQLNVDPRGYRWVRLFSADTLHQAFDLFDSTGVYLGMVRPRWGRHQYVLAWGRDEIAVTGETPEGFPEITIYRVNRGKVPR